MEQGSYRRMGMDDDFLPDLTFEGRNAILASSFPGAVAPPRRRPEPPKPPERRPSLISWEVPPLALPKPSPRIGTTIAEDQDVAAHLDDEDEDEGCVFALDGGPNDDDPDSPCDGGADDLGFDYELVGLDGDDDDVGAERVDLTERVATSFLSPCVRYESEGAPSLGASPTLLSAIEHVAAEAEAARKAPARA